MSNERNKIWLYSLAIWASGAIVGQSAWHWRDLGDSWGLGQIFFVATILVSIPGLLLLPMGIFYIDGRPWKARSKQVALVGWASLYPLLVFVLRYLAENDRWWLRTAECYIGFQAVAIFALRWPGKKNKAEGF